MQNKALFRVLFAAGILFFGYFLAFPLIKIISLAFTSEGGQLGLENFTVVLRNPELGVAFQHSFLMAGGSALFATMLGFFLSFTINFRHIALWFKKILENLSSFPMFLPTLAYGYTMIYAFGAQGFVSRLHGGIPILNAFGPQGILLGFVIYTFPISFVLINSSMKYVDSRLFTVSRLMGDNAFKRFVTCIFRPMLVTLALSLVQCFFLAFTDFGLPSALGGSYPMISTLLYTAMQGALANVNQGTVVAIMMLLPTIVTTILILILQKYQVKHQVPSALTAFGGRVLDWICQIGAALLILATMAIFLPIFIVPMVQTYPYQMNFTLDHLLSVLTALVGTLVYFILAYLASRSPLASRISGPMNFLSNLTNAIPGMVLGVAFMLTFSTTTLNGTLIILLLVNLIHFFATPFQMANQALIELSKHYETAGLLLGDNFFKVLVRIILPNMRFTLLEMMSYLFIQSMVTISAIVFLVGVNTQTLTTTMQSLQQFNKFADVFVLALLIFFTNLMAKILFHLLGTVKFSRKSAKKVAAQLSELTEAQA